MSVGFDHSAVLILLVLKLFLKVIDLFLLLSGVGFVLDLTVRDLEVIILND